LRSDRSSYSLDYGTASWVAHIFNAYGENESPDLKSSHVIPSVIRSTILHAKEGFRLFGGGKQERAFLYAGG